ncbi:MAG: hypothetical protein A2017_06445 [Lentisphaerae bacterium GWF2_44_16]|nr:MAG: hypothetical protein A2017_06445 [Lentisphaerae bacterium GWF2_44_16]
MKIDVKQIWENVKANSLLLQGCKMHEFEAVDNAPFLQKYKCKNCGGIINNSDYLWFTRGFEMASNKRVLTCVYCGVEYPQDTPSHGAEILTEHIKVCEKHPMREAEAKIAKLEKINQELGDLSHPSYQSHKSDSPTKQEAKQ